MKPRELLSPADLERIEAAVRAAERGTRGEIVVAVTGASDGHQAAAWRGAALGALAAPLLVVVADWALGLWPGLWGAPSAWIVLLATAAGCAAGLVAVGHSDALTRFLASDDELEGQVARAARAAFLEHEVFATRDRSGVLIFLSLLEHRVVVMGDAGIDERVAAGEWSAIVEGIVRGIREGRAAEAVVAAVARCGEILDRPGLERRADDEDELPDRVRIDDGERGR